MDVDVDGKNGVTEKKVKREDIDGEMKRNVDVMKI